MKKLSLPRFALSVLLLFFSLDSIAQLVGADVFLQGNYVEIGVGSGGWFGSGAAGPAGYHGRGPGPRVGFVSDPDKDGWTTGVPDYCGDYFIPGYPQEGWDIQVGNLWAKAWLGTGIVPAGSIVGSNVGYVSTGTELRGIWEGTFAGLAIRQTTILKKDKVYFVIKVTLKNTTSSDIDEIYYDRTLDPDNTSTMGPTGSVPGIVTSTYATTKNTIEYKLPNAKARSLVSAIGQLTVVKPGSPDTVDYPVYLGIGAKDCRANPYIISSGLTPGATDSPSRLYKNDNTLPPDYLFDSGETNTMDVATGLIFHIAKLKPGDSTSFFMAYVLSTDDLDTAFGDLAPSFIYDGREYQTGDTVKLCRDMGAPDETKNLDIIGGEEYTWSWSPRPGLLNSTGTDNQIVLTNTPTTYVVYPSESFGCMDSMVLTIMPYIKPDPPTVTTPVEYCRFAPPVPLEATGSPGSVIKFYTAATGGTPLSSYTPTTAGSGVFTFYATQTNGICESSREPITVIVNPIPNLDSFTTQDPTACLSTDGWIRFKADKAGETYQVYMDKDGYPVPVMTLVSDASGFITISGLGKGSYTNIYIVNSFGCISNTYFGPIILTGPTIPAPVVSNSGPVCEGEDISLMTAAYPGWTYKWSGPNGFSSTTSNPSFTTVEASGGAYTLIVTREDGCVSDPAITTVVVNKNPKKPDLKDQFVCEGSALFVRVFGEPDADYTWTGGGDAYLSYGSNLDRKNVQLIASGRYILFASNSNDCIMYDTINVTVSPRLTLSVTQDTAICIGDSIMLFAATNGTTVKWSPSTGMNDSTSKTPMVSPTTNTNYTVVAQSEFNACPDTTGTVMVSVIPSPEVKGYDTLVRMNIPYTLTPMYGQEVIKWMWQPADSLNCSACPNPVFNSNRPMSYVVTVTNKEGCTSTANVNVSVFCDGANVTMPNAFTPNNDGHNDIFYVRGTGFTVKSFSIYNRLGQLVFSKENFLPNDPQFGWDGTFNGQTISDAAGFVYMIEVICFNSNNAPELIKGTVLMIK